MRLWLQFCCYSLISIVSNGQACNRRPHGASGERSPVDENFQILIEGNPPTYVPGQQYNLSLSCANGLKFISFTLVAENENGVSSTVDDMLGHFEIIDIAETKFSVLCENMIESTNTNTKSRIDVAWVAPTNPESGCILIKVAVLQHRNVWFIDDGFLTKRICPEEIDEINSQTPQMDPCCACDEAKYEIILERKWSRNTHAKDYPSEAWRTRFSEIIGASHVFDYRFWEYWSLASRGLQEMAEHGATHALEAEIKANASDGRIRTIIKAPGIMHRNNVLGTTLATVRVDPKHHVISLVSKIDPSPDWIVGVAGLELCLANCTWIEQKVLNLYPWDIGTDAGPSYMSADQPQVPPDVVRRITSTFPSDYRSPFYDGTGAPIKPLATLYINRKKLYERDCDLANNVPLECATHPWNSWSECTSRCGAGTQYRVRAFKDAQLAKSFNCNMLLSETQNCVGNQCGLAEDQTNIRMSAAECDLGAWSNWSPCSKRCGKGFSTRSRDYANHYAQEKCQSVIPIELKQTKDCFGEDCGGSIRSGGYDNANEIGPQYGSLDEPGLMNTNEYENQAFQTNRRPTNTRNRFSYQEQPQQPFELEQEPQRFDQNSPSAYGDLPRYDSPNSQLPRSGYSNRNRNNEEIVDQSNIYGSEQLVGQPTSEFEDNVANYDNNPYTRNRAKEYSIENQFHTHTNTQPPTYQPTNFDRSAIGDASLNNRYQNIAPTSNRFFPNNNREFTSHQPNDNLGIRETFDEYGRKAIVVEGVDSSNYTVVQEYCFQVPVDSFIPCKKKKIIVRNYWFYDASDQQCKLFTADNCDENKNKFRTNDACEQTCLLPQQNLADAIQEDGAGFAGFGQPQSQIVRRRGGYRRP